MSEFRSFIQIITVILLVFMGLSIYCFFTNTENASIFSCLRNIFSFRDPYDNGIPDSTAEDSDDEVSDLASERMCVFESEDIVNKEVYDKDGKLITNQPPDLTCDKCLNFINKDPISGDCYQYKFDPEYNAFDYTEASTSPGGPSPTYTCTSMLLTKTKCP